MFMLPYGPNPFSVDLGELKQRFRQAQAVCHPDAWASQGPKKQDLASSLSTQVNQAYQALLRPLPRVEYILARNGNSVSEADKVSDFEFIGEVLEIQEELENSESRDEVESIAQRNDDNIRAITKEIEQLIGEENWEEAKEAAAKLRYYTKIARAAEKWLENHEV